jgi:hypothetical protein
MSSAPLRFEDLIGLWEEGQRRLQQSDPDQRIALERVVDALVVELRRRLGGPFSVHDLAGLYLEQGTDWCFAIATRQAPDNPAAWDLTTVSGAAFARYAREAVDYTIGRRTAEADEQRTGDGR